jgi:hypothetical protein
LWSPIHFTGCITSTSRNELTRNLSLIPGNQ